MDHGVTVGPIPGLIQLNETINKVAERLDVAFTTAQRAVEKLESLDILKRATDSQRGRVFCATAIMDIDSDGDLDVVLANRSAAVALDSNLNELWRAMISDQSGASGPVGPS
jgi:hypothetical protein